MTPGLAPLSPPPRYHDECQNAHSNKHGVSNMLVIHRFAEAFGNEPTNRKLPRHTLGGPDALA